ncbi:PAS domain-containing protein [Methylobacterium terricola]|nr:PAS domain-containing protein [Methylobacterium terricola]
MHVIDTLLPDELPLLDTTKLPGHVGSWDWDIAGNRLYADDVVAGLFGLDLHAAGAGVPIEHYEAGIHPEDRAWVSERLRHAAEASGVVEAEYRTRPRGGPVRRVLARGRFYHDAEGRPLRGHGIILDITDRRDERPVLVPEPANRDDHVLERAADQGLALRELLATARRPFLLKLADMLLMELGHELAKLVKDAGGKRRR